MEELLSDIKKMKSKGVAGPGNISQSFVNLFSPLVLQELLCIFNSPFSFGQCPQIWKVSNIILLLKAGKCPSEVASFRPISLISCVVKLLERILTGRLYYNTKKKNLFR